MPSSPPKTATTPDIRTVSFVSLGCPKNLVDSEKMLGLLAEDGLMPVGDDPTGEGSGVQPADAVVVNTCGFLEASKEESLSVIREAVEAKQAGRVKRVVVAGCLVQRHRAKMLEWIPGIDAMVGVFDRDRITEAVRGGPPNREDPAASPDRPRYWINANALHAARERGVQTTGLTVHGKDGKGLGYFEADNARLRLTPRHFAYLRISEGCNQNCAFCTIPSIRGKMRSKPPEAILREARELLADGAFELLLIGQDTTSYGDDIGIGLGHDPKGGLPGLLRSLSETVEREAGKGWIRLMYAYPSNFDDRVVDAFAELTQRGHMVPYLDIPLQHASNRMLTAMRRHVTRQQQTEVIEKLRERVPGMAVRTTFITGFPGETEEDHQELLEYLDEMAFDAMGVFEYSREPGTVAGTMEGDPALAVPPEVKRRRHDELMALQRDIAFEQAAYVAEQFDPDRPDETGCRFDVVIDEPAGQADPVETADTASAAALGGTRLYKGRAYFQAPQIDAVTYVRTDREHATGELVRCTIVASDGYDLIARPSDELERRVSLNLLGR